MARKEGKDEGNRRKRRKSENMGADGRHKGKSKVSMNKIKGIIDEKKSEEELNARERRKERRDSMTCK